MSFSRQITGDISGRLSPQSAAAATDPLLVERCILLSRTTVGTALSNAKCTSRRRATPEESGAAARADPVGSPERPSWSPSGPWRPSRTPWRRRMSKSATKAGIEPERARRIVDIPRFSSQPIPARGAFVADFDTPPPQAVTEAPPAPPHAHPHPFTAPHPPLNRRF